MASPFRVRVFRGEQLLDERIFTDTLVKIGRHSSTHVPLDDRGASFVHAVLTTDDDEIALTDISGRGTFVNGKSIGKKVLVPGDEIRIAGLRILVDRPGEQAPAPAPQPAVPTQAEPPAAIVASPAVPEAPARMPEPALLPAEPPAPRPQPVFGTFTPSDPKPPRRLAAHERPALQLSCFWGDQLLQVTQHNEPKKILMGPTPRCEVKAGSRELPLIEPADEGFALNVEEGMRAHLRRGGQARALEPGLHTLEPTDHAWVETGHLRVEASFAAAPQRARVPLAESIDFRLVNLLLAVAFVASAFVISAEFRDKEDLVADDLSQLNKFVVTMTHPIKMPKVRTDALASLETSDAAPAPKHNGDEGQAGDKTVKHKKDAIGALGRIHVDTKNLVSQRGILAGLSGPGVANMLGTGGIQDGVRAALGNLNGTSYGQASGMEGLGLRGGGHGGGGQSATTYGIGDIKTLGKALGYGTKAVLAQSDKPKSDPHIEPSPPEITGSIDPELIRKVIRDHVSQIRFCYEERLATRPSLSGKVRVRFLVNGEGRVPQASIAEGSTIDDPQLAACLVSRFKSWQFPVPKGGGSAMVTYPVWLRPTGE